MSFVSVVLYVLCVGVQPLGVDDSIAAFAVMIAVQPNRDEFRVGDFVRGELPAAHLCNVERDLGGRPWAHSD